jgi:hypothetical protein
MPCSQLIALKYRQFFPIPHKPDKKIHPSPLCEIFNSCKSLSPLVIKNNLYACFSFFNSSRAPSTTTAFRHIILSSPKSSSSFIICVIFSFENSTIIKICFYEGIRKAFFGKTPAFFHIFNIKISNTSCSRSSASSSQSLHFLLKFRLGLIKNYVSIEREYHQNRKKTALIISPHSIKISNRGWA